MKTLKRLTTILAAMLLMAALCLGQASGKKAMTFQGKVEGVNVADSSLKVNGESVEGWMGAMTMEYPIRTKEDFAKLHPGDHINGTVYVQDEDYSVGDVRPATK